MGTPSNCHSQSLSGTSICPDWFVSSCTTTVYSCWKTSITLEPVLLSLQQHWSLAGKFRASSLNREWNAPNILRRTGVWPKSSRPWSSTQGECILCYSGRCSHSYSLGFKSKNLCDTFSFLQPVEVLELSDSDLEPAAKKLQDYKPDVSIDVPSELRSFRREFRSELTLQNSMLDIFKFLMSSHTAASVKELTTICAFFTLPVTMGSAERLFSKVISLLKLPSTHYFTGSTWWAITVDYWKWCCQEAWHWQSYWQVC